MFHTNRLETPDDPPLAWSPHTNNHATLATFDRDEIRFELEKSKEILLAHSVVDPDFIANMVKDVGCSLAVTTKRGWNAKDAQPFTLNRVGVYNDISYTSSLFLTRVAGLL